MGIWEKKIRDHIRESNPATMKGARVASAEVVFNVVNFACMLKAVDTVLWLFYRFQNLLWSRKAFVDSVKVYNHSYIYMPAFSMKTGTGPSLRVYYTLEDFGAKQAVLFANPNFLRDIGKFWKSKGIHAKRLSTGLFLVSAALGLCEEVTIYGFWPFSVDLHGKFISHHYYDNVLPDSGFHAMPEEFLQLWFLHKSGVLRMQLEPCEDPSIQSSA
ncbi:alpha-N-acetylneuraminide alpha-2,8-sialyltransferase [Antrostomus carolinensis]|uniref:alpha-N-acetylneuraminide alpha-2,8-sialyltransferase n=1 Tax=Antrostomus carolinensis TaxID=279965 RepID=UPI0010A98EAD|nr:alpha-N-acetylneuraminide alpha-2,8-sialyltransferase [Antrostomus carolinensis]